MGHWLGAEDGFPVGKLGEDARQRLSDVTVTFPVWQLDLPRVLFNGPTFPVVLFDEATLGAQAFAFQAACRSLFSPIYTEQGPLACLVSLIFLSKGQWRV